MSTQELVSVGLVGIGGYGGNYLRRLLEQGRDLGVRLTGAVDPFAELSPNRQQLQDATIPIYPDLEALYTAQTPDLLIIASPIQHHMDQTRFALQQGSNVLCEKPLAATIQDGLQTLALEQRSKSFVAIGYNWSYTPPIQALKRDIRAGVFGKPLRLSSLTLWPRWRAYYARNRWAGQIQNERGDWILDSPVNNATAHHLHNMFYLLGDAVDRSAQPIDVQAELYRANAIANYDTAALRAHTADGVEILFYTAHPVEAEIGPIFHLEFTEATVTYNGRESVILAQFHDGRVQSYGNPEIDGHAFKLTQCIEAVRTHSRPLCGIEAALAQTRCMNGAQESSPIHAFAGDLIREEEGKGWVPGLSDLMFDCYRKGRLPAEEGDVPWTRAGQIIDLRDYVRFPSTGSLPD